MGSVTSNESRYIQMRICRSSNECFFQFFVDSASEREKERERERETGLTTVPRKGETRNARRNANRNPLW